MSKPASKAPLIAVFAAVIALIAVLVVIGLQLSKSTIVHEEPSVVTAPTEATPTPELKPAEATENASTPAPTSTVSAHKIDASTDTAMVDSLDFISRQLDAAGQQQLQDDYNVIQTALESQAVSDDQKEVDSLAAVRKAVDGKTAAEISAIADQLKPKI